MYATLCLFCGVDARHCLSLISVRTRRVGIKHCIQCLNIASSVSEACSISFSIISSQRPLDLHDPRFILDTITLLSFILENLLQFRTFVGLSHETWSPHACPNNTLDCQFKFALQPSHPLSNVNSETPLCQIHYSSPSMSMRWFPSTRYDFPVLTVRQLTCKLVTSYNSNTPGVARG